MILVGGVDFGRHNDPTVCCVLDITQKPWKLIRFVSMVKKSWDFHVTQVSSQLKGVSHSLADATGVGDALYERLPDCWGCVLVARAARPKYRPPNRVILSVGFIMGHLAEQLRNRNVVVLCDAPDLRQQLLRFQLTVGKSGLVSYGGEKNYHDDAVFALALAVVCAMLPGCPSRVNFGDTHGENQAAVGR